MSEPVCPTCGAQERVGGVCPLCGRGAADVVVACPVCRASNPAEARTCRRCGGPLVTACPICGADSWSGLEACPACGGEKGVLPHAFRSFGEHDKARRESVRRSAGVIREAEEEASRRRLESFRSADRNRIHAEMESAEEKERRRRHAIRIASLAMLGFCLISAAAAAFLLAGG